MPGRARRGRPPIPESPAEARFRADGAPYNGWIDPFTSQKTRVGLAVGTGVEYAMIQNWTVKFEGIHADLGKNDTTCSSF